MYKIAGNVCSISSFSTQEAVRRLQMPSNPLYTSESSAPQTHLFSATINLTSTVTQFIFTTTSNAGMAAIKDIVSSAIAATGATCPTVTPAPPDTAVSPPAQVSIVSIDQRNASVGSFAPTTTIINNVETPSNQASRLPSSPTSSQTEDADATVASAAAADEAVASGQPDDWEGEQNRTAAAWDLFKAHPKEIDLYPDPREFRGWCAGLSRWRQSIVVVEGRRERQGRFERGREE